MKKLSSILVFITISILFFVSQGITIFSFSTANNDTSDISYNETNQQQIEPLNYPYDDVSATHDYNSTSLTTIDNGSMTYDSIPYEITQSEAKINIGLVNFDSTDLEEAGADQTFEVQISENEEAAYTMDSEDVLYEPNSMGDSSSITLTLSNLNAGTNYEITQISNTSDEISEQIVSNPSSFSLEFETETELVFADDASSEIDPLTDTGEINGAILNGNLTGDPTADAAQITFDNGDTAASSLSNDGTMTFNSSSLDYANINTITKVEYDYYYSSDTPRYTIDNLEIPVSINYDAETTISSTSNITQTTADLNLDFDNYEYSDLADIEATTGSPADEFNITLNDGTNDIVLDSQVVTASEPTSTSGTIDLNDLSAGTTYTISSVTNDNDEMVVPTITADPFITDYLIANDDLSATVDLDLLTGEGTISGLTYGSADLANYDADQLQTTLYFEQVDDSTSTIDIDSLIDATSGSISFDTADTNWDYSKDYKLTSIGYNNDGTTSTGDQYVLDTEIMVEANADTTTTISEVKNITQSSATIELSLENYDYDYITANDATTFNIELTSNDAEALSLTGVESTQGADANKVELNIDGLTSGSSYTIDGITNDNGDAIKPVDTSSNNTFVTDYEMFDQGNINAEISSLDNTGTISGINYGEAEYADYVNDGEKDVVLTFTPDDGTTNIEINSEINTDGTIDFAPEDTTIGTWDYSQTYTLTNINYNDTLYDLPLSVEVASISMTDTTVAEIRNVSQTSADIVLALNNYDYSHITETEADNFEITLIDESGTSIGPQTITSSQGETTSEAILNISYLTPGQEYTIDSITNTKSNEITDITIDESTPTIITDYKMSNIEDASITVTFNPLTGLGEIEGIDYGTAKYDNYDASELNVVLTFDENGSDITIDSTINSDGTITFDTTTSTSGTWVLNQDHTLTNINYNTDYNLETDVLVIENSSTDTTIKEINNITQTSVDIVLQLNDYTYQYLTDTNSEDFIITLKDSEGTLLPSQTVTSVKGDSETEAILHITDLSAGEEYTIDSIVDDNQEFVNDVIIDESEDDSIITDYEIKANENTKIEVDTNKDIGTISNLEVIGDLSNTNPTETTNVVLEFTDEEANIVNVNSEINENNEIIFDSSLLKDSNGEYTTNYTLTTLNYNVSYSNLRDNQGYSLIDLNINVEYLNKNTFNFYWILIILLLILLTIFIYNYFRNRKYRIVRRKFNGLVKDVKNRQKNKNHISIND